MASLTYYVRDGDPVPNGYVASGSPNVYVPVIIPTSGTFATAITGTGTYTADFTQQTPGMTTLLDVASQTTAAATLAAWQDFGSKPLPYTSGTPVLASYGKPSSQVDLLGEVVLGASTQAPYNQFLQDTYIANFKKDIFNGNSAAYQTNQKLANKIATASGMFYKMPTSTVDSRGYNYKTGAKVSRYF